MKMLLFFLLLTTLVQVLSVHDGDTLTVLLEGHRTRVRLHGIDAPELRQPGGHASQAFLEKLVLGKSVRLELHGEDRYGRTLAVVYRGERSVNGALVQAGMAWWYRKYAPDDGELRALEEQARAARRGLWEEASPVAPWEFRHRPRS